ncbi:protein NLRC3-like isoform X1 [Dysidea avara]|uniref:protein NLRC3-like isoform X1 n=2 Tax=Dysidea avara TaxID=196820 RepID=UPI003328B13E
MNGGIKEISNALFVNDSIHSLTLKGVVLRDDEICMLMDALAGKPIQHLNLSNNLGCCSEGAKAIAMFIGTCATLLSLTFSFDLMMLSEKGFESFVSQFRCHGKIIPEYIKCDLSGICALTDALNNNLSLTSLDISPPLFWECDEWWHKLTSNIQQMRSLKSLHLPGYNLNLNNVSALVHFIHFNKSLVSLNISGDSIDDTGMGALCNALCYNETLKLLDVSKNEVNFTDNIAQVLWNNYNLTCLALGSNKISDEGCRHLAIALSVNKTLTSLYVRDNMIGDDGAKELAGMFAKNATLLQMDLSFNDIRDEGAKALVNALCVSGGLKILLIIFNDIKFEECLLFNPHITIDNKFFAYTADFWNAIPLLSAQFVMGKHVYFTEQKFYGEWKGKKLNKINLQNVYNHIIPEDQLDCLKYYQQNEFGDNDSNNDDGGNNDSNNDD